ncbi:MAG: DUF4912 domain-containing protein [Leptolyngbyaceae cyanobacterium CSU_1_3]|nr:DUF4912 domain-containing protein [Leptolyngbyaceae cyanobacterium CSU_1_3]
MPKNSISTSSLRSFGAKSKTGRRWAVRGGAIRLIDQPDSDTRQSFRSYSAFKTGKFGTGATAEQLSNANTKAVIQALGKNGVSYLPANQLKNQPGVRAIPMHGTAPTDPRYPFSQALFYVYKGATANPAAAAFLGYATAPKGQQAVQQAGVVEGAAAQTGEAAKTASAKIAPEKTTPKAGNVAKPADKGAKAASLNAPNKKSASANATNNQIAQVPATADEGWSGLDLGLPSWLWWLFPLGSLTALFWMLGKGRDSRPAAIQGYRDPNVDFPGGLDPLQPGAGFAGDGVRSSGDTYSAGEAGTADWGALRNDADTYAIADNSDWLVENPNLAANADPNSLDQFGQATFDGSSGTALAGGAAVAAGESARSFLASDHDSTQPSLEGEDASWGSPATPAAPNFLSQTANAGGAALAGGVGAAWSFLSGNRRRSDGQAQPEAVVPAPETQVESQFDPYEEQLDNLPGESDRRLVLSPRNAQWAYAYWDLPRSLKAEVQRQGGENLVLRLYDVTELDPDTLPEAYEQFDCDDFALSCDVPIAASDRTYVAEIGYLATDGRWLKLERSTPVWVPSQERMG